MDRFHLLVGYFLVYCCYCSYLYSVETNHFWTKTCPFFNQIWLFFFRKENVTINQSINTVCRSLDCLLLECWMIQRILGALLITTHQEQTRSVKIHLRHLAEVLGLHATSCCISCLENYIGWHCCQFLFIELISWYKEFQYKILGIN